MGNTSVTRTCCACRKKGEKAGFIRVVRTPEGKPVIDPKQKVSGRGAYLCRNLSCIDKAEKIRALGRSLHLEELPDGLYETIQKECLRTVPNA